MPAQPLSASINTTWMANHRASLQVPIELFSRMIDAIRNGLGERDSLEIGTDLVKLSRYTQRYIALLDSFESAEADLRRGNDSAIRGIKHDLQTLLSLMIGICEYQLEQATEKQQTDLMASLQKLLKLAKGPSKFLKDLVIRGQSIDTAKRPSQQSPATCRTDALAQREDREEGRVLIVDESPDNQELLLRVLARRRHAVTVVPSPDECFRKLQERDPLFFDVILIDTQTGNQGGEELLDRLKADPQYRLIPVLMISALDEVENVVDCIGRGAEDFLTKPINPMILRARVQACIERRRSRAREIEYLRRIDSLLHNLFPAPLVPEIQARNQITSRRYEDVGVLFLDVVGFTAFCEAHREYPEEVVNRLQTYILEFEAICARYDIMKIKTIGDALMATAGLLQEPRHPIRRLLMAAEEMIQITQRLCGWRVRIGLHIGPVVAGVLGQSRWTFDLWGNTVNMAARMESHGIPGRITLSPEAFSRVSDRILAEPRDVAVRGIGPLRVWDFVRWIGRYEV